MDDMRVQDLRRETVEVLFGVFVDVCSQMNHISVFTSNV